MLGMGTLMRGGIAKIPEPKENLKKSAPSIAYYALDTLKQADAWRK